MFKHGDRVKYIGYKLLNEIGTAYDYKYLKIINVSYKMNLRLLEKEIDKGRGIIILFDNNNLHTGSMPFWVVSPENIILVEK